MLIGASRRGHSEICSPPATVLMTLMNWTTGWREQREDRVSVRRRYLLVRYAGEDRDNFDWEGRGGVVQWLNLDHRKPEDHVRNDSDDAHNSGTWQAFFEPARISLDIRDVNWWKVWTVAVSLFIQLGTYVSLLTSVRIIESTHFKCTDPIAEASFEMKEQLFVNFKT